MPYYTLRNTTLMTSSRAPADAQPLAALAGNLLPPLITELHRSFAAWGQLGLMPGQITPEHVWSNPTGQLTFFDPQPSVRPLPHVGLAPALAAWLVLLDKYMETFVVIARARAVWSPGELAGALTFMSPAYLPIALIVQPPNNWERVARALAQAISDGPLQGEPVNRHWRAVTPPQPVTA
jgi:hypothetical protein